MYQLSQLAQRSQMQRPQFAQSPMSNSDDYQSVIDQSRKTEALKQREALSKKIQGRYSKNLSAEAMAKINELNKAIKALLDAESLSGQSSVETSDKVAQIQDEIERIKSSEESLDSKSQSMADLAGIDPEAVLERELAPERIDSKANVAETLDALAKNKARSEEIYNGVISELKAETEGANIKEWIELYNAFLNTSAKFPNAQGQLAPYKLKNLREIKEDYTSGVEKADDRDYKRTESKENRAFRKKQFIANEAQRGVINEMSAKNFEYREKQDSIADKLKEEELDFKREDRAEAKESKVLAKADLQDPSAYDTYLADALGMYEQKQPFGLVKMIGRAVEPGLAVNDAEAQAWQSQGAPNIWTNIRAKFLGTDAQNLKKLYDVVVNTITIKKKRAENLLSKYKQGKKSSNSQVQAKKAISGVIPTSNIKPTRKVVGGF